MISKFLAWTWCHYCHVPQNASSLAKFHCSFQFLCNICTEKLRFGPFFTGLISVVSLDIQISNRNMYLALFTKLEVTGSDALGVNFVTALDFSVNLAKKGSTHEIDDKL